jgi:hypothetical protein
VDHGPSLEGFHFLGALFGAVSRRLYHEVRIRSSLSYSRSGGASSTEEGYATTRKNATRSVPKLVTRSALPVHCGYHVTGI